MSLSTKKLAPLACLKITLPTNSSLTNPIYEEDLTFNNLQGLIGNKILPTKPDSQVSLPGFNFF